MRSRLGFVGAVGLLAVAWGVGTAAPLRGAAAAEDFERIEKAIAAERAKIFQAWLDLATDLGARDLREAAVDAVARARAIDPEAEGLEEAASRASALAGRGTMDDAARKRVEKAKRDAAKGYERMAAVLAKEQQDSRYTEWLVAALGLEPTKARVKTLADMGRKDGVLLQSPAHRLAAHVSYPAAWKSGKDWPVLVCLEGEGAYFEGSLAHFRETRAPREWIVVCPHTLSSSVEVKFDRYRAYGEALVKDWNGRRMEFDEPGLLALLDFLHEHFGAARKVAVTGYSTGAHLAYRLAFRHPERVHSLALACPKYDPLLAVGATPVEGGGVPVLVLAAEGDPGGASVEAQVDAALKELEKQGHRKVTRKTVPGTCSDFPAEVWEFVAAVRD
jgi:dienelactone hydrolase